MSFLVDVIRRIISRSKVSRAINGCSVYDQLRSLVLSLFVINDLYHASFFILRKIFIKYTVILFCEREEDKNSMYRRRWIQEWVANDCELRLRPAGQQIQWDRANLPLTSIKPYFANKQENLSRKRWLTRACVWYTE